MLKAKRLLDSDIAVQRQLLKITKVLTLLQSNLGVWFRKQLSSTLLGMCVQNHSDIFFQKVSIYSKDCKYYNQETDVKTEVLTAACKFRSWLTVPPTTTLDYFLRT